MHIACALRRKWDEIAATIAAYETRIDAARMDLAALEQTARLFDPEADRDETPMHLAMAQLALQAARANGSDHQDAGPFKSIGVWEHQFTAKVGHPATQAARESIPGEFFYLDWP
jgi:hypothetical protein